LQSENVSSSNGKNNNSSSVIIRITSINGIVNEFYAVWSGQFTDKQAEDVIEVSASAITQNKRSHNALEAWRSNEIVSVSFLPGIVVADRIHLRPESSFDWDIVSTQAIHIENQLLRSLAVVQQDQIVSIAVSSSLKAHSLIERVEAAASSSLAVARVANGTELVIAPYHHENVSSSQIVSSIADSGKEAGLTVTEMMNKLPKVDFAVASQQYPLRILPQLYRSQPTAYNLSAITSSLKGMGGELSDDYLDAFLDQSWSNLSFYDYNHSTIDDFSDYPWHNAPIKDDEFTIYVHPVFVMSALEIALDCGHITLFDLLASFMKQTNYQQWVGIIHTDGKSDARDSARSCVMKVVVTDLLRVALPLALHRFWVYLGCSLCFSKPSFV